MGIGYFLNFELNVQLRLKPFQHDLVFLGHYKFLKIINFVALSLSYILLELFYASNTRTGLAMILVLKNAAPLLPFDKWTIKTVKRNIFF